MLDANKQSLLKEIRESEGRQASANPKQTSTILNSIDGAST
jgi:hypothetical protein